MSNLPSRLFISAGIVLLLAMSSMAAPKQTEFMAGVNGLKISETELQVRSHNFAHYFASVIEVAADQIRDKASSRQVRENAILWKMDVIPAMQALTFRSDPMLACIVAWMYCAMMDDYFQEGAGKKAFGKWQPIAVQAVRKAEAEIVDLFKKILPNEEFQLLETDIHDFVKAHPISNPRFVLDIPSSDIIALGAAHVKGGFGAVAQLNQMLFDMTDRIRMYAEFAPKQIRWQTELMMEQAPELLARESKGLLADMRQESAVILESVIAAVDTQRKATIEEMKGERALILEAVQNERKIVIDQLREERAVIIEALHQERVATLDDIRALSLMLLEEAQNRSNSVMDRFFLRTVQILALPFLMILILAFLAFRTLNKSKSIERFHNG